MERTRYHSEVTNLNAGENMTYGHLAACSEAVIAVISADPGAEMSVDASIDGDNWVAIDALQTVPISTGDLIPLPYAGIYAVMKVSVSGVSASLQCASYYV